MTNEDLPRSLSSRVALFVDVDNVLILAQNSGLPFHLHLIIDRVRQQGTIMSSKAYADWTASLLRPVLGDFRANAIELVQLPTSTSSKEHKNTADIQLTVDALEMVFSPVRPETIVIVGGDRDYVPLVQKLKRYGVFVMGIGVEAGVSSVLVEACDSFVYYDDLVPPAPEELEEVVEPATVPDPAAAYSLMRRAVDALHREGRTPTGASVHSMMKQLDSAFDLGRYKTNLKTLAQDAQEAGYVELTENPGSDITLMGVSASDTHTVQAPEPISREYDYSTFSTIVASYRTILQERRIPLLPWQTRKAFIELIWNKFDERESNGLSFDAIYELLTDYADKHSINVSQQMIRKLLYTLNFALCFSSVEGASEGYKIAIPGDLQTSLYPVVAVEEAITKLHTRYLEILAEDAAILDPDAVFEILYGEHVMDETERIERLQTLVEACQNVKLMKGITEH